MMKQKELVPKRRFVEYKSDWDETNLGELVTIKSGWSPSNFNQVNDENGSLFIKVDDLNYSFREQKMSNMRVVNNSRFEKMKKGSIIFPKRGAAILTNKVRITDSASYMDTNMMALEPEYINGDFLYTFIGKTGLYKIADTSTVPQINNKHIEPYVITLPSRGEQQKIGQFFKHLDEMITLEQRKIDKTKALKSAYLAEMFPAKGERVPKRRFAGFTGEWKKYKLKDFAEISTGKAFSSSDFYDKGEYLVITNKNIKDQVRDVESKGSRINISEKVIIDNYVLNGNNILVTMDGNVGRVGKYSNGKAVLAQRVARLNSEQLEFIYQVTRSDKFITKMNNVSVGNIIKHISLKQISDYTFKAPKSNREQQKIGEFFKKIDDTISNHQGKLDKLKAAKQAYLHEMFV